MSSIETIWSDIRRGDWVDTQLPATWRPYARLMRLDRPIGTWLLLLPCWWSVALAATQLADFLYFPLFAIGAIIMRGAGCVVNDLYDRDLDAQVERTSIRPLASGEVKPWQAIILLAVLLALGLLILLCLNRFTIFVGAASLALVFTYPLMKRITWWPQLFLGFTFNWGALVGWTAVRGTLDTPAIILYVAGIFWTLAYDTIYAHQDIKDDALVGVKSTARLFAENSKKYVSVFYGVFIALLALMGYVAELGWIFYLVLLILCVGVTMMLRQWNENDPANCLKQFKRNRDVGLVILLAIILGWVFV